MRRFTIGRQSAGKHVGAIMPPISGCSIALADIILSGFQAVGDAAEHIGLRYHKAPFFRSNPAGLISELHLSQGNPERRDKSNWSRKSSTQVDDNHKLALFRVVPPRDALVSGATAKLRSRARGRMERVSPHRQAFTRDVAFGSRVDGALARAFFTYVQHWSGAVTCPAC